LGALASPLRTNNYVQKSGANQDQIETLIANLANSPEPGKLIDVANQIAQLSRSESISLEELENRVKQKQKEKQILEDEIKQRRANLESWCNLFRRKDEGLKWTITRYISDLDRSNAHMASHHQKHLKSKP